MSHLSASKTPIMSSKDELIKARRPLATMEEEDEDYEVPISTATMNSGSLNDTLRWLVSSVDDIRNRMTLMDQRLFLLVTNGAAFHRVQNIGGPRMPTFPMLRESNALVSAEKEHWSLWTSLRSEFILLNWTLTDEEIEAWILEETQDIQRDEIKHFIKSKFRKIQTSTAGAYRYHVRKILGDLLVSDRLSSARTVVTVLVEVFLTYQTRGNHMSAEDFDGVDSERKSEAVSLWKSLAEGTRNYMIHSYVGYDFNSGKRTPPSLGHHDTIEAAKKADKSTSSKSTSKPASALSPSTPTLKKSSILATQDITNNKEVKKAATTGSRTQDEKDEEEILAIEFKTLKTPTPEKLPKKASSGKPQASEDGGAALKRWSEQSTDDESEELTASVKSSSKKRRREKRLAEDEDEEMRPATATIKRKETASSATKVTFS